MRRKLVGFAFLATFFLVSVFAIYQYQTKKNYLKLPEYEPLENDFFVEARSAIGTAENPNARREYWFNLQKDPSTGGIPADMRRRELRYAATLPKKSSDPRLRTAIEEWESAGPYNAGGRTRAVRVDVSNENIIVAGGVSGGVYRTTDGGEEWQKMTSPQSLHSVTSIAQDTRPGKNNVWYYGTGEIQGNSARAPFAPFRGDGIFKSTDSGVTWQLLPATAAGDATVFNSQFQYIWRVVTNPFNASGDEVYAAIIGAIVRSTDGGASWEFVLGQEYETTDDLDLNDEPVADFTDVEIASNGVLYAVISESALSDSDPNEGVYRSVNGTQWTKITPGGWPDEYSRVVLAAAPSNPDVVYFLMDSGEGDDQIWKYTYLSGNGTGFGGRWENLTDFIPKFGGELGDYDDQNSYNMLIRVHPGDEDIVFLGGTNLYRSSDGFTSTSNTAWIGGYDTANNFNIYANHYVDQHDLFFFPGNPDKMLSVNDGGVFVTQNNRTADVSWQSLNRGFVTAQAYTVGFDAHTPAGFVISGYQDNGTLIANNPASHSPWTRFLGGDGGYCDVTRGQDYIYSSFQDGQTYRFSTTGSFQKTSFARVDPRGGGELAGQEYLFVNPFVLDPNNNNIMYLAGGDVVWRNLNLSQIPPFSRNKASVNWERIPATEVSEDVISAISASSTPENIVYYGSSFGELFRIDNALEKFPQVTNIGSSLFPENAYIISIAIDRTDADNILVAFSNYNVRSIFHSDNGGESFTHVSGNLEEFEDGSGDGPSVRWVDIYPKSDGSHLYFAATSTGLYSAENLDGNNTVWTQEGASNIGNVVSVMVKHRPADGTVFLATHGGGIFKANFSAPAPIYEGDKVADVHFASAFPNPFTTLATIPYFLPEDGAVRVKILNMSGQEVKTLMWSFNFAGKNYVTWDGTNTAGVPVASGVYLCQLEYADKKISAKLVYQQ